MGPLIQLPPEPLKKTLWSDSGEIWLSYAERYIIGIFPGRWITIFCLRRKRLSSDYYPRPICEARGDVNVPDYAPDTHNVRLLNIHHEKIM